MDLYISGLIFVALCLGCREQKDRVYVLFRALFRKTDFNISFLISIANLQRPFLNFATTDFVPFGGHVGYVLRGSSKKWEIWFT